MGERTRSAPLRDVFPDVDQLRIELIFNDTSAYTPSPQLHTLYPAAPAFFRFACPCADCDGDFDLTGAVASLIESTAEGDASMHRAAAGCNAMAFVCATWPGRRNASCSSPFRANIDVMSARAQQYSSRLAAHSPSERRARRDHAQSRHRAATHLARGRSATRRRRERAQRDLS